MSVLALIDPADPLFWRVSFAIVGLGGAIVLVLTRGYPVRRKHMPTRPAAFPVSDQLDLAAYIAAAAIYIAIAALACAGGPTLLRAEEVLLTMLVFLGFNAAWLLLFDDADPSRARSGTASSKRAAMEAALGSDTVPPPGRQSQAHSS